MDDAKPITEVVEDAPEYRESLDDAVKRLAALTDGEYEQVRNSEAKKLDVRAKFLDDAVSAARGNGKADGGLDLFEPEPWDKTIDGNDLLDRMVAAIREYVIAPEHVAEVAALWVVHAHVFDLWQVTPRLAISAPTMRSGKSLMKDVLGCLVPRAIETENLSAAVMFRAVDKYRPTMLVDEVDTFLFQFESLCIYQVVLGHHLIGHGQVTPFQGVHRLDYRLFHHFSQAHQLGLKFL